MQGKATNQYEILRTQFIQEILAKIEAQRRQSSSPADEAAITELSNYFSLNNTKLLNQIFAQVQTTANKTSTTVTISSGVFSTKSEQKLTPFAESLLASLQKFNPTYLLTTVESSIDQMLGQSREEARALQRRYDELLAQKEEADDKLRSAEKRNTSQQKELEDLEKNLEESDDMNKKNLDSLKKALEENEQYKEKIKKLKSELKKLKQENTELKMKSVELGAQVSTLTLFKDRLDEELKTKLAEIEKLKKETDTKLEKSEALIAQQRAIITQNQQYITDQLENTINNVNQTILDQSMNTSRILRDRDVQLGKQNRAPTTAAKAAASQAKVFQAAPAPAPAQAMVFDNDSLKDQYKYITNKSKEYLTEPRMRAIFAVAKFVAESEKQSVEYGFGVEAIKLLAPVAPTTHQTTAECIQELDRIVAARQLKSDRVVTLQKTLHGLPVDAKQKQLDAENQGKLLNALHLTFKDGYAIPELQTNYPAMKRRVAADTTQEFMTPLVK